MRTKRVALHRSTVCSRVAGGEERLEVAGGVRLAGRPAKERRGRTSGKDVPFVQAKRGVVNIASGYTL